VRATRQRGSASSCGCARGGELRFLLSHAIAQLLVLRVEEQQRVQRGALGGLFRKRLRANVRVFREAASRHSAAPQQRTHLVLLFVA